MIGFDLTKVWPHSDYPLHDVGRLTLNRNPSDFHTEIEQAAFEPNNLVPGIGPSPDKMLLAHSYSKGGTMRMENVSDPVYAPNSKGGPTPDPGRDPEDTIWSASGEFIRAAYTKRAGDNDFVQPGTLVREVMDDVQRDRLVSNVVGHLKNGVSEPVLERAFEYWRNIDSEVGDRIFKGVQEG